MWGLELQLRQQRGDTAGVLTELADARFGAPANDVMASRQRQHQLFDDHPSTVLAAAVAEVAAAGSPAAPPR